METYCCLCNRVVAPADPEAREHQNQRVHGACLAELNRKFPSVIAAEHEAELKPNTIFRRVRAGKLMSYRPEDWPPSPLQSAFKKP